VQANAKYRPNLIRELCLCCKIDYSRDTDDKIITFELCFMRCGNFFERERECDLGMGREWEGNGNEIQQSWEWEWEWELLHGNGREQESKTHSRTPLIYIYIYIYIYGGQCFRERVAMFSAE